MSEESDSGKPLMRLEALNKFFDWAIAAAFDCQNLDGGEIQDKAVELGLCRIEPYDEGKHGPRGRWDWGLSPGDSWYVKTPAPQGASQPTPPPEDGR